jgi:hypothetical protein
MENRRAVRYAGNPSGEGQDRSSFEAQWTGHERKILMPNRVTLLDKSPDQREAVENAGLEAPSAGIQKRLMRAEASNAASYADPANYCWADFKEL